MYRVKTRGKILVKSYFSCGNFLFNVSAQTKNLAKGCNNSMSGGVVYLWLFSFTTLTLFWNYSSPTLLS